MYRLVVIFCVVFSWVNVLCQDFAPQNAKWTYNVSSGPFFDSYPTTAVVLGDTTILGVDCIELKIMLSECMNEGLFELENQFIYEDSSKVYWYNEALNQFRLLYDFNAQLGQSWTIVPPLAADSFSIIVDSIDTIVLNSDSLKRIYCHPESEAINLYIDEFFVEKIGFPLFIFPQYYSCNPKPGGLRCYTDATINTIVWDTVFTNNCDSIISTGIIEVVNNDVSLVSVVPNPFDMFIELKFQHKNLQCNSVVIFDVTGRKVMHLYKDMANSPLDVSSLISGIYFLKIEDTNSNLHKLKMIKK